MSAALLPSRQQQADRPRQSGLAMRVFRIRESGILVVLVVFVAVTTGVQHRFLGASNIQFILVDTAAFALLALGETMVVISRNVDLSVGSVVGLSAYRSPSSSSQAWASAWPAASPTASWSRRAGCPASW